LQAGLIRRSRGGIDVILLDLGLPDSEGGKTFTAAQAHGGLGPLERIRAAQGRETQQGGSTTKHAFNLRISDLDSTRAAGETSMLPSFT